METVLLYILKSAGILAIFFLSYFLFLKKETFFTINRHYLLAGIIASLLLPLVVFTNYVYIEAAPQTFNPEWLLTNIPIETTAVAEIQEPFNWLGLVGSFYLIGVLVFGLRFFIQLTSLFKLFNTNTIKKSKGFKLVEVSTNISPFSFFNYIVYNPKNYSNKDLEIIINHEKAHSNQLHSIDILLSQLYVTFQWFNPIAWLYKKSIQQNLEFMADQFAVKKVDSAKQYQHTLLKASVKPQYASITNNFYNSLIKKRIVMLNQSKSKNKNAWKYVLILPALALFLMSFNVKTVEIIKEDSSPSTTNFDFINNSISAEIPIEKIDKTQQKNSFAIATNSQKNSSEFLGDIKVRIDKNTTNNQLDDIVKMLKEDGIAFSYKNVRRNANNEITGISITYKDSNNNSGNYQLSSDNPINTFYFYKEENGSVGFKTEHSKEQREKMEQQRELVNEKRMEMTEERKEMMEERKAMSEERREEMEKHMEERRKEHKKVKKEHEKLREKRLEKRKELRFIHKDSLHKNVWISNDGNTHEIKVVKKGKSNALFIIDGEESDSGEIRLISPDNIESVNVLKGKSALSVYGDKGKDGVIEIITKTNRNNNSFTYHIDEDQVDESKPKFFSKHLSKHSKTFLIKKSATDQDLKNMKSALKSEGLDFKYSKLKRNKAGEITRIKLETDNNKGRETETTFKNDEGIGTILLKTNGSNLTIDSI